MPEAEPWSYYPDGSPVYSLADIIRKRAATSPGLVALAEAGRSTTFGELDRRSSQVARALRRKDVRPGDRVAYIGASGPEFAEVMYGAAKCRAIFTAVNNRLSAREVLAVLADAEPRVVIVDPPAAPWSPTSAPSGPNPPAASPCSGPPTTFPRRSSRTGCVRRAVPCAAPGSASSTRPR
jgi:acyl-CoA synthetase (AMP-forming)/AMP-acid ligase II